MKCSLYFKALLAPDSHFFGLRKDHCLCHCFSFDVRFLKTKERWCITTWLIICDLIMFLLRGHLNCYCKKLMMVGEQTMIDGLPFVEIFLFEIIEKLRHAKIHK